MTLQLNEPTEIYRCGCGNEVKKYDDFYGRNTDKMPELIAEGRIPLSVAGLINRRLGAEGLSEKVKNDWQTNYFDTGDASTCGGEKGHLVVIDAQLLREMNAETPPLYKGAIALPNGMWNELKAQKESVLYLTADEAAEAHGEGYNFKSGEWTPANRTVGKVWDHLGRGQNLTPYIQLVSEKSGGSENVMNLYFNQTTKDDKPTMRLWYVYVVGGGYGSDASGYFRLVSGLGRLVGVHGGRSSPAHRVEDSVVSTGGAGVHENFGQKHGGPYRTPAVVRPSLDEMLMIVENNDLSQNDKIKEIRKRYRK